MDLNDENHGIAPRSKTVGAIPWTEFMALSGILKIHGIAPEYKYYAVFLK